MKWQGEVYDHINTSVWWMSLCPDNKKSLWLTGISIPFLLMLFCPNNTNVSLVSLWSILILSWQKFLDYMCVLVLAFLSLFIELLPLLFMSPRWLPFVCFDCCIIFWDMASAHIPIMLVYEFAELVMLVVCCL